MEVIILMDKPSTGESPNVMISFHKKNPVFFIKIDVFEGFKHPFMACQLLNYFQMVQVMT